MSVTNFDKVYFSDNLDQLSPHDLAIRSLGRGSLLLSASLFLKGQFGANIRAVQYIPSKGVEASFVENIKWLEGREDNSHLVRFGDITIRGPKREIMHCSIAIKSGDLNSVVYEYNATNRVNSLGSEERGDLNQSAISFKALGIASDMAGRFYLVTEYDSTNDVDGQRSKLGAAFF